MSDELSGCISDENLYCNTQFHFRYLELLNTYIFTLVFIKLYARGRSPSIVFLGIYGPVQAYMKFGANALF